MRPSLKALSLKGWWHNTIVDTVDHLRVIERIIDESRPSARYVFMTMMSAGIAVLGLLLSSPAVVIGAMLISPLMGPILGIGFALATFDFAELRRAVGAFALGCVIAVLFTAAIVLASPLQATTSEIISRTRPNLFDLLVALFAALAGTFAIIRGRGETIVGVAIATALMPPLAVIGYGLATWNLPVLTGSLALFGTNFLTIALAATVTARFYGFGHHLSHKQTMMQTGVLIMSFLVMGVPLALALGQIAREALFVGQVRSLLLERFGSNSRVTQLDVDFHQDPWAIRSIVIAPREKAQSVSQLRAYLEHGLSRTVSLDLNEILVDPAQGAQAQHYALERANAAAVDGGDESQRIAELLAVAAGVSEDRVTIDRKRQRAVAAAASLPGADLSTYYALEKRSAAAANGWAIELIPPASDFPVVSFAGDDDKLGDVARRSVLLSAWAARRWNISALAVPGLKLGAGDKATLPLSARRANDVAALVQSQGVRVVAAPADGASFRLSPVTER